MTDAPRVSPAKAPLSVVLVGISGMGGVYLRALLDGQKDGVFRLVGTVEPHPERCPDLGRLLLLGIPMHKSLEDFYAGRRADLAVIASPIHFHCEQTLLALERGSHVLCEKPPAATVQEVRRMMEAQRRAGRQVAVGYQWSFNEAIQSLKNDAMRRAFGEPKRLRCLYLWPRDEAYYQRNDWAGKRSDGRGHWILDSPAHNAMAHDLHNMFYILGETRETSARPHRVEAELYRAHPIENFDTIALRCQIEGGAEVLFYASHAAGRDTGPVFSYEFAEGTVSVSGRDAPIRADYPNGEGRVYGLPDVEPLKKLWDFAGSIVTGGPPACGLEAALSQTLCLNGAQDSMPVIQEFPEAIVRREGEPGKRTVSVEGLAEALTGCYELSLLPSEMDLPWAKGGRAIDLTGYGDFPSKT